MKRLIGWLLAGLMSAAPASANQSNLWSPTVGTVSGLQLTNNYNGAFSAIASCNSGVSAPANDVSGVAVKGQCWLDSSVTPNTLKIFDGTVGNWLVIGYLDATNHIWTPVVGSGAVAVIASGATTDLCSTASSYVEISGVVGITSFGSSCITGQTKWIRFQGALTLTHNAASLFLPNGGANITTVANDTAQATYLGSGNWRVISYIKASGFTTSTSFTTFGDANYGMLTTDHIISTNAALSLPRTLTLVAANAVQPGTGVRICDGANGVTSTNTLTVSRAGADTIVAQGTAVTAIVLQNAGACIDLNSDGTSKWLMPSTHMAPQPTTLTTGSGLTYTTPVGAVYIRVRMVGGGGGGGGAGAGGGNGGNGSDTSFGAWTAIHGSLGLANSSGGAGGTGGVNGTGTVVTRIDGAAGIGGDTTIAAGQYPGGIGGGSFFGGAGNSNSQAAGGAGKTNSGSGGGGAGGNGTTASSSGGGGAGEFVEFIIPAPAATYTYTVGGGGTAGAGAIVGGAGAAGRIEVTAYFQ